ncbi:MAG TPA: GNAT family protein [Terriglobales bacterium]|nr:GNAT family protein [Terriglobales bacterium]
MSTASVPTSEIVLRTKRLLLRPFRREDFPQFIPLIGAREVAATTLRIPHPYTEADAEAFLNYVEDSRQSGSAVRFILFEENGSLCGGMGLHISRDHNHAEIGYWIGVPFWGKGYATEGATAVVEYGFEQLKLNRIFAGHYSNNPASGSILRKLGMKYEGTNREHIRKWGEYLDVEMYAILASEWHSRQTDVK